MKTMIEEFKLTTNPKWTEKGAVVARFSISFEQRHHLLTIQNFSLWLNKDKTFGLLPPNIVEPETKIRRYFLTMNKSLSKYILDNLVIPEYKMLTRITGISESIEK